MCTYGSTKQLPTEKKTRWFDVVEDLTLDFAEAMTTAANASSTRPGEINGRNFYVYLVPDGDEGSKLVLSSNSTFPNDISPDYTANNTRKFGQYATLCADAGANLQGKIAEAPSCGLAAGNKVLVKQYDDDGVNGFYDFYNKTVVSVVNGPYYDVVTVQHPLAGFVAGDILPESVFCLSFRPESSPDGMVYDIDTNVAADIYLQSGKGRLTASEYNATVTNLRAFSCHQDDMRHKRKRLLHDYEFSSVAAGSNETTAINGAAEPHTTGGHVDSAGRRMLSFIGCEDCCGAYWQWLEDVAGIGAGQAWGNSAAVGSGSYTHALINYTASTWYSMDGQDAFGAMAHGCTALLAGGSWNDSSFAGSRARNGNNARSNVNANIAGRGAIRSAFLRENLTSMVQATPAESSALAECQNTKRRGRPTGSTQVRTQGGLFFAL